jgi:hypothetical protein
MKESIKLTLSIGAGLGLIILLLWSISTPIFTYTTTGIITDKAVGGYNFYLFINNTKTYRVSNDIYAQFHVGDTLIFTAGQPLLNVYEVMVEAKQP